MNNFILKRSIWLIALCFMYVQVQAQCEDFTFASIYDGCECCDSYIYFELAGGTPPYNVVTEFGQEIFSGIAANDVNPQAFETNLIATDANGCEASGVAVFAYFCCEVPPPCEVSGLTYGCDEGLQLEAFDIFGGPGDCEGLETITLNGNEIETGVILENGVYVIDVEVEYPPCTFYTFTVEVSCGEENSCDIENPLSLPWMPGVLAQADCFCNYQLRYDCYNEEGLFILEPGFPTICSDIQTFYYNVDGNLLCTAGGLIGAECPEYQDATGGEIIWICGGDDCLANAGTISGDETICGFGAGFLNTTAPSIAGYEYVYIQVEGDAFFVLENNITYDEGCYHGVSYEIANPPNFEASSFSEFLSDEIACFAVTPCFYVEYIFAPEFEITTQPFCDTNNTITVGITIYGGSGEYVLSVPDGQVFLSGDGQEHFVDYPIGFEFYDIYPIDAITNCGNDYIASFIEPDCSNNCICDDVYDPVCGVDGNTYDNACFAECAEVDVAYLGECETGDICSLPPEEGPCNAAFLRYYYDANEGDCATFTWGGCGGNANNFETYELCMASCGNIYQAPGCTDVANVDFGDCEAIMGVAVVNGECVTVSGCLEYVIDGVDYTNAFYESTEFCFAYCLDPCALIDCSDEYDPVCGVNGITYTNACLAECAGVEIAYDGVCTDEPLPLIFETYSWLSTILNPIDCAAGDVVTEYDLGIFSFIFVESNGEGVLYFEDGTYYCQNASGFDCVNVYGLGTPTDTWSCGNAGCICDDVYDPVCGVDGNTYGNACEAECVGVEVAYNGVCEDISNPALFDEYPWLSSIINPNNCTAGDVVSEYNLGVFSFIFVESNGEGVLYFEDGTYYCQNASGFDCVNVYGLGAATDIWSCGNAGCICDDVYDPVCGVDGNTYGNACEAECAGIEVAYSGVCEDISNPALFDEYSWLSSIINPNNCTAGDVVSEYDLGSYSFIFVESNGEGVLYFEDGTYYCQNTPGFDCVNVYGLGAATATWSCGGVVAPNPEIFNEYVWLNDLIDIGLCEDEVVTEYDLGDYSFIYVESNGIGTLYFEDGFFYCQDFANFNCLEAYGLDSPTDSWVCGGLDRPASGDRPAINAENESRLEKNAAMEVFTMYPNPTTDRVVVQLISEDDYEKSIQLYDARGSLLQEIIIPANSLQSSTTIDVQDLPTGIYMIQLSTPNQSSVQRLIKR